MNVVFFSVGAAASFTAGYQLEENPIISVILYIAGFLLISNALGVL